MSQYQNVLDNLETLFNFGVCDCASAEIKQGENNKYIFILKANKTGVWIRFDNLFKIEAIKLFLYCCAIKLNCQFDNALLFDFVLGGLRK